MTNPDHDSITIHLAKSLGISFDNPDILVDALTHRSYLNENRDLKRSSNERLEFLGDAILSFLISKLIYTRFPEYPEGKLTFIRTFLVRTETLAQLADSLKLGDYLYLSRGEELENGRRNPLLLANSFEAVTGAIFLDQGIKVLEKYIYRLYEPLLATIKDADDLKDSKSLLQEKLQTKGNLPPVYDLVSASGPDHQREFTMGVYFNNELLATGIGHSKREAEEKAAAKALEILVNSK